jgi:hypothetical protein
MATFGDIRFALQKQVPGIDQDVWDGFIMAVYQEILDRMSWQRMKTEYVIQTPAEVNGGTLTATQGNQAVVSDAVAGPLWSAALNGRMFRIASGPEYYQFTFQSTDPATGFATALLDRPYEADEGNGPVGSLLSYQINQNIFPLPAAVRLVEFVRNLDEGWPLTRLSNVDMNVAEANRGDYGDPGYWLPSFDQNSNPPVAQIEIYPVPQNVYGLAVDCVVEDVAFGVSSGSISQVWVRPSCIIAGARSLASAHLEKFTAAEWWGQRFATLISQTVSIESQRIGPQKIRMADRFTRHRILRATNLTPQVRMLP